MVRLTYLPEACQVSGERYERFVCALHTAVERRGLANRYSRLTDDAFSFPFFRFECSQHPLRDKCHNGNDENCTHHARADPFDVKSSGGHVSYCAVEYCGIAPLARPASLLTLE